jgi:hypothetical protein
MVEVNIGPAVIRKHYKYTKKKYYSHEMVLVIIMSTALKSMTKASNQLNLSLR